MALTMVRLWDPISADLRPFDRFFVSKWQPWASLLVHGIKRFEGRVWNSDFRGRLWIHSATHSLEESEIRELEEKYAGTL